MYQVALCEDEQIFAEALEEICRTIFLKRNIKYQISVFAGGADFLRAFAGEGRRYDLILLDIIMEGMNGMELARTIREADEETAIIFITSTKEYLAQGYDVDALHYLEKPIDAITLERLIARDYAKRFRQDFFMFDLQGTTRKVALREIICLETSGRRVEVTLTDGTTIFCSGKLAELLAGMPAQRFIRCHQAFAVNLDNIRELDGREAVAVNGKRIPVSRTYVRDVEKTFMKRFRDS